MNAREFLSQAYRLDERINSKVEQIKRLNELAEKTTSTITDMPKKPSASQTKMADAVEKIADLKMQLSEDMNRLIDIRREIGETIGGVENIDCRLLLELRYLCYHTWEEIAIEMNCTVRNILILHSKALKNVRMK